MILTNIHNLPAPLVSAVAEIDRDRPPNRLSVTDLLKPPQMRLLELAHRHEIVEDASDRIWILLGRAIHRVLEFSDTTNRLPEERLTIKRGNFTIVGVPDLYDADHTITDWKITSVWSFLLGLKSEWEQQTNLYAHLYREHGFQVDRLQIVAICRDWNKNASLRQPDYPKAAVAVIPVPLWDVEKAENFLRQRLVLHADIVDGPIIPGCTDAERWKRDDSWAVVKRGNKRAWRVKSTPQEAQQEVQDLLVSDKGKYEVQFRPGANVRCASYCRVAAWCPQWAQLQATESTTTEDTE